MTDWKTEEQWDVKHAEWMLINLEKQENEWTKEIMPELSLTVQENWNNVKNRLAAEQPESLQMSF